MQMISLHKLKQKECIDIDVCSVWTAAYRREVIFLILITNRSFLLMLNSGSTVK
jgi:hypothetical protein